MGLQKKIRVDTSIKKKNAKLNIKYAILQMMFWTCAASAYAYLTQMLQYKGFTDGQIGVINAVKLFSTVVFQIIIGVFSDRHAERIQLKYIISVLTVVALLLTSVFYEYKLSFVQTVTLFIGFGATFTTAFTVVARIEQLVQQPFMSLGSAISTFTGQNMGAGNYKRINKIVITGEICVTVVGLVLGNLVVFFGHPLLSIYSSSSKVIAAGMIRLKVVSVTYALCGMMDVMVGALRGIGYSIMPMIVSMIGACGLRLVWLATIFQIPKYHTVHMIYVSYPITWAITFFAHICCFIWAKRCVEKKAGVLK